MTIQILNNNNILSGKNLLSVTQNKNTNIPQLQQVNNSYSVNPLTLRNMTALKGQILSFQGVCLKERIWIDTAKEALALVDNLVADGKKLDSGNKEHVDTVEKLKTLGGDTQEVVNPDNPQETIIIKNGLSIKELNKGKNLEILRASLNTMLEATEYKPTKVDMGNYNLAVNNSELVTDIKPNYTTESFDKLFKKLETNHVFDIVVHSTLGLAKTAGTDARENFEMGARYWATDTCHNINLMKNRTPEIQEKVGTAVKTIARFYKENEKSIQNLIDNPQIADLIKEGKIKEAKLEGIPHIFIPIEDKNAPDGIILKPDEEFNRWRWESHGNALKTIVTGIKEGLVENKPYGLKPKDINNAVIDTIGNLTTCFKAIDYPNVPSGGNWEETPFTKGLTYDTAVIVDALKATKDLMHNPEYDNNAEIIRVRERLANSTNGKILIDEKGLDELIKAGECRVKETYDTEAPGYRAIDASQAFTVKIAKFDDNPVESAKKALKVLSGIEEKLGGDYGIARYEPTRVELKDGAEEFSSDSYLGPNYCVAADKKGNIHLGYFHARDLFGAKDCSTPELFSARAKLCGGTKEETAQWFFDPVMSTAYNKVRKDLIQYKKKHGATSEVNSMIKHCFEKQTEYLNRGVARITGEDSFKANGIKCPAWGIPEAYMKVSTLKAANPKDLNDKSKQGRFVPGLNTPLAWAQTEQFKACKEYEEALKEMKQ